MRPRVYLASCLKIPEPDADQELLVGALQAAGVDAEVRGWDDPTVDWSQANATVIRSTWNYFEHYEKFLPWVARIAASTKLFNSGDIVTWNSHKRYLRELEQRGFPIVPTWFVDHGSKDVLTTECAARGWSDVVVKPAVSGGSYFTQRFTGAMEGGNEFLAKLAGQRDMMVQPYVRSVDGYGERSIIWLDGALTHAIRKTPRFIGGRENVSEAFPIAPEEAPFASALIESMGPGLLYARCDLARDDANQPMIMELELIEPSLFLRQAPAALDRFVAGIVARAKS